MLLGVHNVFAVAAFGTLLVSCSQSGPSGAARVVLTNVHVVDMDNEREPQLRTVTVADGFIESIVGPGEHSTSRDDIIVDGNGGYLSPGLIDAHTHVRSKANLPLYVVNGVTTVREMNGSPAHLRWKRLVAEGSIVGPNMVVASPITTSDSNIYWRHISEVEEVAPLIDAYLREGYDFVKIYELEPRLLQAVLETAAKSGIGVVGHYPVRGDFKRDPVEFERALASGMASIEHLEELFEMVRLNSRDDSMDDGIELLRRSAPPLTTVVVRKWNQNRIVRLGQDYLDENRLFQITHYLGPTHLAEVRESLRGFEARRGVPADTTDVNGVLDFLKRLHDSGVILSLGTDSHSPTAIAGFAVHEELALYLQAGLSPAEALTLATVNGAGVSGLNGVTGSISIGKRADLILLTENPLENLSALRRPIGVMIGGRWFGPEELERMRQAL